MALCTLKSISGVGIAPLEDFVAPFDQRQALGKAHRQPQQIPLALANDAEKFAAAFAIETYQLRGTARVGIIPALQCLAEGGEYSTARPANVRATPLLVILDDLARAGPKG